MTNDERNPKPECRKTHLCGGRFRHSDFVIPSDFVICYSDLRIAVCSIKRPVRGLVRAGVSGSVHGKPPLSCAPWIISPRLFLDAGSAGGYSGGHGSCGTI